jgi:hypothetical protein
MKRRFRDHDDRHDVLVWSAIAAFANGTAREAGRNNGLAQSWAAKQLRLGAQSQDASATPGLAALS